MKFLVVCKKINIDNLQPFFVTLLEFLHSLIFLTKKSAKKIRCKFLHKTFQLLTSGLCLKLIEIKEKTYRRDFINWN